MLRTRQALAAATLLFLAALLYAGGVEIILRGYGHVSYYLYPSAPKALQYAERHFEKTSAHAYDPALAEYWLVEALKQDPQNALAHYQFARVSFLQGEFIRALYEIDSAISLYEEGHAPSFYMKGLIFGYMGRHEDAAENFERYLALAGDNWAALNDYAWTLLQAGRIEEALKAAERGLLSAPENPWLLNTAAVALFESGNTELALERATAARAATAVLTEADWLVAYPGNDPSIAKEGVETMRRSTEENVHKIEEALQKAAVQ